MAQGIAFLPGRDLEAFGQKWGRLDYNNYMNSTLYAREYTETQLARMKGMQGGFTGKNAVDGDLAMGLIASAFILFFILIALMAIRESKSKRKKSIPVAD